MNKFHCFHSHFFQCPPSSSVCMFQVLSLKWMRWQKGAAGVPTERDLHLLPAPRGRPPAAAPPGYGCLLNPLWGINGWSIVRILGTVARSCCRVLRLVSTRNSSVPAGPPTSCSLWPAPSWPPGRTATWWSEDTWGRWIGIAEDILPWGQEVTSGRAGSSGTRTRRSSARWRSLLVKRRCLGRLKLL